VVKHGAARPSLRPAAAATAAPAVATGTDGWDTF